MKKPTLEDLVTLAHQSGMRVSVDLVPKRVNLLILIALPNGKWLRKVSWDACWHLLLPVPGQKVAATRYRRLYKEQLGGIMSKLPEHVRLAIREIEDERKALDAAYRAKIKREVREGAAARKAKR
jgi:hypothetical protein